MNMCINIDTLANIACFADMGKLSNMSLAPDTRTRPNVSFSGWMNIKRCLCHCINPLLSVAPGEYPRLPSHPMQNKSLRPHHPPRYGWYAPSSSPQVSAAHLLYSRAGQLQPV